MKTLTASRTRNSSNYVTTVFKLEGKVKLICDNKIRQPRKGLKYITINQNKYLINWDNCPKI